MKKSVLMLLITLNMNQPWVNSWSTNWWMFDEKNLNIQATCFIFLELSVAFWSQAQIWINKASKGTLSSIFIRFFLHRVFLLLQAIFSLFFSEYCVIHLQKLVLSPSSVGLFVSLRGARTAPGLSELLTVKIIGVAVWWKQLSGRRRRWNQPDLRESTQKHEFHLSSAPMCHHNPANQAWYLICCSLQQKPALLCSCV